MGLSSIESNYNFLNLTGGTRGVQGVGYTPYVTTTSGGESEGGAPSRAVDRLPKAQMVTYKENLPAQAGYEAGFSTKTLIA